VDMSLVTPNLVIRACLELAFLLIVLCVILLFSDFRSRLRGLGAGGLIFVYLFVGSWSVVQMVDRWQYEFPQSVSWVPLTRFAMYQVQMPESVAVSYKWTVVRTDGSRYDANITELFRTVGVPGLSSRMRNYLELGDISEDPESVSRKNFIETELALFSESIYAALGSNDQDVVSIQFSEVGGSREVSSQKVLFIWTPTKALEQ